MKQQIAQIEEFESSQKWFWENQDKLLKKHKDKFVAVWHKAVIDADEDLDALVDRVYKKVKGAKGVYINYVTDKPLEIIL